MGKILIEENKTSIEIGSPGEACMLLSMGAKAVRTALDKDLNSASLLAKKILLQTLASTITGILTEENPDVDLITAREMKRFGFTSIRQVPNESGNG